MLGAGELWSLRCRVCWVSAGDMGAACAQGVGAHARLGSWLLQVRVTFKCCSGGLPGAAWLFGWFDPASWLGLGLKAP